LENSEKGRHALNLKEEEKRFLTGKTIRASLDEHFNSKKSERKVLLKINSNRLITSGNKMDNITINS